MNLYNYEDVRVVHLELTEKCQATCPMCDRNVMGGADNPNLGLHELTVSDIQKILPVAELFNVNPIPAAAQPE